MRTKEEILKDISQFQSKYPVWGGIQSLTDQLTIEVLIDIRDEFATIKDVLLSINKTLETLP